MSVLPSAFVSSVLDQIVSGIKYFKDGISVKKITFEDGTSLNTAPIVNNGGVCPSVGSKYYIKTSSVTTFTLSTTMTSILLNNTVFTLTKGLYVIYLKVKYNSNPSWSVVFNFKDPSGVGYFPDYNTEYSDPSFWPTGLQSVGFGYYNNGSGDSSRSVPVFFNLSSDWSGYIDCLAAGAGTFHPQSTVLVICRLG